MKRFLSLLLIVSAGRLFAQAAPDAAEQKRIIEALRETALAYDGNLPNFICTQVTNREVRQQPKDFAGVHLGSGRGGSATVATGIGGTRWEPSDSREETLTYFGRHESYQLIALNGRPVKKGQTAPPGMTSSGEFGSTLTGIFDPRSHAVFEWKRWDTVRGQPVYVFDYRVEKENSVSMLDAAGQSVVVGYHGQVYADRTTRQVLKVTTFAESPRDFPLKDVTKELDYGEVVISAQTYMVPLHGKMEMKTTSEFMRTGRSLTNSPEVDLRNNTEFRNYRKYGVEATLKPE